ncbi:MAG TPA: tRNA pseudouridine(38-40) synthase TruA [Thermoanaerobaculales bacterium]|nr:tRNA pseudouridine(38-40) synthase TruA [Thermoanaerobaculales bacterium]HQL30777.1 tRNA pseudouridine(38-40) synthase TruA [Thermoanaerobaculales bacterium]HQN97470.1 tRNA pseudouridine(38-40) synthase TruA [Thermoanaerobaculales bacterium]
MPTYRMTVEYDGTKFSGWQVQRQSRTVQGVLTDALRRLAGHGDLVVRGAGRTDAGVHALAQVASVTCREPLAVERLLAALARELPADLAVRDLRQVEGRFHARHDALLRSYRYQLARRRSAFGKRYTWWVREPIDTRAMSAAAAHLTGRHDFAALSRRDPAQTSTVVVVEQCRVIDLGELVLVRVVASHFLWGQVRRMVGALVAVGRGEARPDDVPEWLSGAVEPPVGAAPASGLFLEKVLFAGEPEELPPLLPVGVPWSGPVDA